MLRTLMQDLRYGARQLRTNPGFTAVAVLSLALGIGANSAIFQLVDAVRLRTFPVSNPAAVGDHRFPQRIAALRLVFDAQREPYDRVSGNRYSRTPSPSAAPSPGARSASTWCNRANPAMPKASTSAATTSACSAFNALAGRTLTADDDRTGCGTPGAVISYPFWQREFGGDRSALGRQIALDGRQFPIIGITPPGFFGVEVGNRFDVAIPFCSDSLDRAKSRTAWWISAMGRLKPGWTVARATTYLKTVSPAITEATLPPSLPPGTGQALSGQQVGRAGRGHRHLRPPPRVRKSALAAAGRHRTGAADRLRQPGQPAAGARQRARTRDRRAPGHRRVARTPDRATAFRKPAARRARHPARRGAGADHEPRAARLPHHRRTTRSSSDSARSAHDRVHRRDRGRHLPAVRPAARACAPPASLPPPPCAPGDAAPRPDANATGCAARW